MLHPCRTDTTGRPADATRYPLTEPAERGRADKTRTDVDRLADRHPTEDNRHPLPGE